VNLLDLVKKKPLEKDDADDLLFGGRVRFDPLAMPAPAQPVMLPLPQPFMHQPAHAIEQRTHGAARIAASMTAKKLAVPVGVFVVVMGLLSVYLAKGHSKSLPDATTFVHAPPPTPTVAQVTPQAQPPVPPPAPAAGPIVTPIDDSSQQPAVAEAAQPAAAETTPPSISDVQPTVPTVPDTQAAVATDDVHTDAADEKPVEKTSSKRKHRHHHRSAAAKRAKRGTREIHETRVAVAEPAKSEKPTKAEKLGGKGALQISCSPAREVWIDGRNTKQMTPQKLTLAPGAHNITLVDKESHNAKTLQVEIEANKTLRVSKSY
jgi:hypothetical protein